MKNRWIKWGVVVATLVLVTGLSLGAVMTAQAQDTWSGLMGGRTVMVAWFGGPHAPNQLGQRGGSLATIAKALGISESDLTTALKGGKSVADVAKEKGIDLSKVVDALVAEQTNALKQAVTSGRLTQQQADDRIAKLKTDLPTMLSKQFPAGMRGRGGPGGFGPAGAPATIAKALGISESALLTELKAGKTVADVAKEKNVDLGKVVDAIVAERTEVLKQAVTNGRLTQQQADDRLAKLKTELPTMLSKRFPAGPRGFGPGKPGRMGPVGFAPTIAATLGISETTLATELKAGKSVADVAQEKGVELSKIVDAIVAKQTEALKQAVTDGRITQQQADKTIATLKVNLPHLLSLKYGMGGMMGPRGRFGGRGFRQRGMQNQPQSPLTPDGTQHSSGSEPSGEPFQSA